LHVFYFMKITLDLLRAHIGKVINESRSPAGNWLQLTLAHVEKGKASISVPVRKEMCNPFGNIHGGMMSLVIDEAIGWAIISLEAESHYTSLNLNVDFLYAAPEGETITAVANVVRQGKKIIHAEVHVFDSQNRMLAKAASNLIVTSMKIINS
jgi:acyl-coenzyme A thioesterase 13